jgi:choline kinase
MTDTVLRPPERRLVRPIPVHVVILAAGRGSRLGTAGDDRPKWLLPIGGRTLADRQLEGIRLAGDAVASTRVVVGHAAAAIDEALAARGELVESIRNLEYAERNNWWSALRALQELPSDEPVVILNSDLLIDPKQQANFLRTAAEGTAGGLLAVDFQRRLTDESMKVSVRSSGTLNRIGKTGVDAPVGEYIGMLMARGAALMALRETLEVFVGRPDHSNEWYEGAIRRTAAAGVPWYLWPVPTSDWVEIDDERDLEIAASRVIRS